MNIAPTGRNVVVKELEDSDQTESGLYLPQNRQKQIFHATVVALGNDVENTNLKVGETILARPNSGFTYEGYRIINEEDIVGILSDG